MPTPTSPEWVDIGGWTFGTAASICENLDVLWTPVGLRGVDVVVPSAAGTVARPRVADDIRFNLRCIIFGDYDQEGVAHANSRVGIGTNITTMVGLVHPPSVEPFTRTITHRLADGTERTAECIASVGEPRPMSPIHARIVVSVTIPSGEWTAPA